MKLPNNGLVYIGLIIITWLIFYLSGLHTWFTIEQLMRYKHSLHLFVNEQYYLAVFSYISIYCVLVCLGLPVAAICTTIGGFMFGIVYGVIYSVIAATIGACVVFFILRGYSANIKYYEYDHKLQWLRREFERYGPYYLLAVRCSMVVPFFLVNMVAPLLPISLRTFAWTTALGIIPGSSLYAYVGGQLSSVNQLSDLLTWHIAVIILIFVGIAILPIIAGHLGIFGRQKH